MKIVINKCFGEFDVSPQAVVAYMKKKNKDCFVYSCDKMTKRIKKIKTLEEIEKIIFPVFYSLVDCGETVVYNENLKNWFFPRDIKRDDKDLIATVEELGEKANTWNSRLKVVEIPENIEWEIIDYDGVESIHEKHKVWE